MSSSVDAPRRISLKIRFEVLLPGSIQSGPISFDMIASQLFACNHPGLTVVCVTCTHPYASFKATTQHIAVRTKIASSDPLRRNSTELTYKDLLKVYRAFCDGFQTTMLRNFAN